MTKRKKTHQQQVRELMKLAKASEADRVKLVAETVMIADALVSLAGTLLEGMRRGQHFNAEQIGIIEERLAAAQQVLSSQRIMFGVDPAPPPFSAPEVQ